MTAAGTLVGNPVAAVRPRWAAGVRLVPTTAGRLRVLHEAGRSATVAGADQRVQSWLRQLDGQRAWRHQLGQAAAQGIDAEIAAQLLEQLWQLGLLEDGAEPEAGRPAAAVTVFGRGQTAHAVAQLLGPSCALAAVPRPDLGTTEAVPQWARLADSAAQVIDGVRWAVLVLDGSAPDGIEVGFSERLHCAGVRHLVVGAGQVAGRVGPFVVPGRTPCLRCEQLARRDWDPEWLDVARQTALQEPEDRESNPALSWLVAAEGVRELRGLMLDDRLPDAQLARWPVVGGVLEACEGGGAMSRRPLSRHVACGCWWSELSATTA